VLVPCNAVRLLVQDLRLIAHHVQSYISHFDPLHFTRYSYTLLLLPLRDNRLRLPVSLNERGRNLRPVEREPKVDLSVTAHPGSPYDPFDGKSVSIIPRTDHAFVASGGQMTLVSFILPHDTVRTNASFLLGLRDLNGAMPLYFVSSVLASEEGRTFSAANAGTARTCPRLTKHTVPSRKACASPVHSRPSAQHLERENSSPATTLR
jgi:hypothetical protein